VPSVLAIDTSNSSVLSPLHGLMYMNIVPTDTYIPTMCSGAPGTKSGIAIPNVYGKIHFFLSMFQFYSKKCMHNLF